MLSFAVGRRETAHGNATYHVRGQQLSNSLPLIARVIHSNIFKRTLLRSQRGKLKGQTTLSNYTSPNRRRTTNKRGNNHHADVPSIDRCIRISYRLCVIAQVPFEHARDNQPPNFCDRTHPQPVPVRLLNPPTTTPDRSSRGDRVSSLSMLLCAGQTRERRTGDIS